MIIPAIGNGVFIPQQKIDADDILIKNNKSVSDEKPDALIEKNITKKSIQTGSL
ncbi:MAG: hypothetical protein ACI38A_07305 [Candidatus Ornithomonoglobus sp.]